MGNLLSFPNGLRYRGEADTGDCLDFHSITRELEIALGLLDQMAAKVEQMDRLLPTQNLRSGFEKRRLEIHDQIKHAHLRVASLMSDESE